MQYTASINNFMDAIIARDYIKTLNNNEKNILSFTNKYLNIPLKVLLKGLTKKFGPKFDKTLKELYWSTTFFNPTIPAIRKALGENEVDNIGGVTWPLVGRIKLGTPTKNGIAYNIKFIQEYIPENITLVMKHEIAHAIDWEIRGFNYEGHDDFFHILNGFLWGDPSIGDPQHDEGIVNDVLYKYAICFEPYKSVKGGVYLTNTIPPDYDNKSSFKYAFTSIVDIFNKRIIDKTFPDESIINNYIHSHPFSLQKLQKLRTKLTNNTIYFEQYTAQNMTNMLQENNTFKSLLVGAGLLGSTLGGASDVHGAVKNQSEPNLITYDEFVKKYKNKEEPKKYDLITYDEFVKKYKNKKIDNTSNSSFNNIIVTRNSDPLMVVAATLYTEASGESKDGKLAVASVIVNRSKERKKSLKDICLQKSQFSYWNGRNTVKIKIKNSLDKKSWNECYNIAKQMVDGEFKPTINSNHYYNPYISNPYWGKQLTQVKMIGKHRFGRL